MAFFWGARAGGITFALGGCAVIGNLKCIYSLYESKIVSDYHVPHIAKLTSRVLRSINSSNIYCDCELGLALKRKGKLL